MALDLIGAGFGRTGTLSLKHAIERLGLAPCYHMTEVMGGGERTEGHLDQWISAARGEPVDWNALFTAYKATVDWPAAFVWRPLITAYPDAKVVLSKRDGDRWYDSVMKTIWPASSGLLDAEHPKLRRFGEMAHGLIWQGTFDGRIEDRAFAISVFEKHNAQVEAEVPADRLLVYEPGEGWDRLCAFLGVPVPDEAFPHLNSSDDFGQTVGSKMELGKQRS